MSCELGMDPGFRQTPASTMQWNAAFVEMFLRLGLNMEISRMKRWLAASLAARGYGSGSIGNSRLCPFVGWCSLRWQRAISATNYSPCAFTCNVQQHSLDWKIVLSRWWLAAAAADGDLSPDPIATRDSTLRARVTAAAAPFGPLQNEKRTFFYLIFYSSMGRAFFWVSKPLKACLQATNDRREPLNWEREWRLPTDEWDFSRKYHSTT